VENVMEEPLPVFDETASYSNIAKSMEEKIDAVLVKKQNGEYQIITKHDIINALTK